MQARGEPPLHLQHPLLRSPAVEVERDLECHAIQRFSTNYMTKLNMMASGGSTRVSSAI